jgi:hypothetical protein
MREVRKVVSTPQRNRATFAQDATTPLKSGDSENPKIKFGHAQTLTEDSGMAERINETRRFVVTGQYQWTGPSDIEIELTPTHFRWRFVGEKRFRQAPWNAVPASLESALDADAYLNSNRR